MLHAYIFTNGDCLNPVLVSSYLSPDALIICADGGGNYLYKLELIPDLIIGDLDSILPDVLENYRRLGVQVLTYPSNKDYTDTQLAVNWALEHGATEITICCGLGNRFDHSLANVHLLVSLLDKRIPGRILTDTHEIFVTSSEHKLKGVVGQEISFLPLTPEVRGITLEGFLYPLRDATFRLGNPIGISNVFTKENALVRVESGILLGIRVFSVNK